MILLVIKLVSSTLLVSALFTPLVMDFLLAYEVDFGYPFSRVFDRVAMVVAAGLIIFWRSRFDLSALMGVFQRGSKLKRISELSVGVFASVSMVAILIPLLVSNGLLVPTQTSNAVILQKSAKALVSGLLVSVIEESFFRVLLLSALLTRLTTVYAALVSSVVYAFVHFISPVKSFAYEPGTLLAGFHYLYALVERAVAPGFLTAFLGLLIVGLALCGVIRSTRSIYLCIGLHAGWVLGIKITRVVTSFADPASVGIGAGERYFLVTQPQTWIAVIVTASLTTFVYKRLFLQRES